MIGLAVDYFNFAKHENQALDLRLEFRPALNLGVMRPWVALETTSDGSVYAADGRGGDGGNHDSNHGSSSGGHANSGKDNCSEGGPDADPGNSGGHNQGGD